MSGQHGRTGLPDAEYEVALSLVRDFVSQHGRITNAALRAATSLNYDQAIKLFKRAIAEGVLERRGRASGTHYVLPSEPTA